MIDITRMPPRPTILLVDDDPFMLGLQSRMLHAMGYQAVAKSARCGWYT